MILHHSNVFKFIFILISIQSLVEARLSKIIETLEGQIQGLVMKTVLRRMEYSSFRGIPYAKPPVGNLRFRPPVAFTPVYNRILSAVQDANMCHQYDTESNTVLGNEDCLYLNVYTPEVKFESEYEHRAVMVWIHGGAFMWGSNNSTKFGPDYLLEKNVVVVAMNYRLGAFGFVTAGNSISGNMGLKDQVMALQWVKDNIIFFGGDPNKVTIFGESAGAVSVELHRLSPLSQGLFRASIAMSGSPLNPWAFSTKEDADEMTNKMIQLWRKDSSGISTLSRPLSALEIVEENTKGLLREVFYDDLSPAKILKALKLAHVNRIARTTYSMMPTQRRIPFLPTTENPRSFDAFLTTMPENSYKRKMFSTVPHIIGYTSSEFIGISEIFYPIYKYVPNMFNDVAEVIFSEQQFYSGIEKTLKYTMQKGVRVWLYVNSFDYPQSLHRLEGIDKDGCGHADDVAHIFYVQGKNQPLDFDSEFAKHRERIVTLWTNFAKYLNVTADRSSIGNIRWPPARKNGYYLDFDTTPRRLKLDRTMLEEFVDDHFD